MNLIVPDEPVFDCPEGCYTATLYHVKLKNDVGNKTKIRPLFVIDVPQKPGHPKRTYLAGRFYEMKLTKGSLFREDLEKWLGKEFFERNVGKQFDLKEFIGKRADVRLAHIYNPKHETPFVDVVETRPLGTLVRTSQFQEILN